MSSGRGAGALLRLPRYKNLRDGSASPGFTGYRFRQGKFVMSKNAQQPNWVTAVFQNAAVSIEVAHQTTLAQLAEQLGALGELHGKLISPVRIRVPS